MRAVNEAKGGFFFLMVMEELERLLFGRLCLLAYDLEETSCGRTAHSRFAIPLNPTEDSTCNIKQEYILRFKDTSSADKPFGGKTVVLGGDFRQILSVIAKGSRQDIVNTTLNSSYLKAHSIGDGRIGSSIDGIEKVQIPGDLLINNCDDPISAIVESTYPDFFNHSSDIDYLQQRAILASTLDMVESINEYMVSLNHSPAKTYLSSDTVCISDHSFSALEHVHTPEFLNSIKYSGIPNHSITLK
ncbi:PREDICTED: uncharacterized protein LOC109222549, partial [Nicotiana attenuata]|uniref:uncharacterized protein LOC109222549 n=1 Tax=Nicotiana attenuata TaxID=49451 RepID=UPI000905CEC0